MEDKKKSALVKKPILTKMKKPRIKIYCCGVIHG
jgi:hypothetical protein